LSMFAASVSRCLSMRRFPYESSHFGCRRNTEARVIWKAFENDPLPRLRNFLLITRHRGRNSRCHRWQAEKSQKTQRAGRTEPDPSTVTDHEFATTVIEEKETVHRSGNLPRPTSGRK
jgi:hypothetical protein